MKPAHSYLDAACRAFKAGDPAGAQAALSEGLTLHPTDPALLNARGLLALQLRDLASAVDYFCEAIKTDPLFAEARANLHYAEMRKAAEAAARQAVRLNPGFREEHYAPDEFLLPPYTRSFTYAIEVVDACNLRCPSCPRGNLRKSRRSRGMMKLPLFERVLEKIDREKPVPSPSVWLFNWGEPLLHKQLPDMLGMLRQRGYYSMLSSNLSLKVDFHRLLKAGPDEIKISLSGHEQHTYGLSHAHGQIDLVKKNMRLLRQALDETGADTRVWCGFHVYRHNNHEVDTMRRYAEGLGFHFHASPASFNPLENMVSLCEERLDGALHGFVGNLPYDPKNRLEEKRARLHPHKDCEMRFNMMSIGVDGLVDLCCGVFKEENRLGVSFLEHSHEDLQRLKYRHPFCGDCYRHGLQSQNI